MSADHPQSQQRSTARLLLLRRTTLSKWSTSFYEAPGKNTVVRYTSRLTVVTRLHAPLDLLPSKQINHTIKEPKGLTLKTFPTSVRSFTDHSTLLVNVGLQSTALISRVPSKEAALILRNWETMRLKLEIEKDMWGRPVRKKRLQTEELANASRLRWCRFELNFVIISYARQHLCWMPWKTLN